MRRGGDGGVVLHWRLRLRLVCVFFAVDGSMVMLALSASMLSNMLNELMSITIQITLMIDVNHGIPMKAVSWRFCQ